jgi:biopolymer transport protein TolR
MGASLSSGGGRGRRSKRAPVSEINVTPLVDVMLVLLIIFMVTAPLLNAAVPVNLPDSSAKALDQQPQQVNISMSRDGRLYLEDREVDLAALPDRLAALPPGPDGKPPLVTLRADKSLDYGQVVAVMGELNRAGFNAISLVTNSASGSEPVIGGSGNSGQD